MIRYLIAFYIFSLTALASAQEPLTWKDCMRLTNLRNPNLLSARKSAEASRSQYSGSYNGILPKLSLNASLSDGSDTSPLSRWRTGGTASLNLFNLDDYASIRSASASLDQSLARYHLTSSNVLSDLHQAFAGLLFAQEQIGVARRIREVWKHNADLISLRYKSGRESKGNRMRTSAEFTQAEADVSQSVRDLRVARQTLNEVLGGENFTELTAKGALAAARLPEFPHDITPLMELHPKVIAQRAALAQAKAALLAAESPLFPTLSASYTRSFTGESFFPSNPSWTAAGVVSYPLFGEGPTATYFAMSEARQNVEKTEYDLQSTRFQVRTEMEAAWSNYAGAQDQVQVQRAFLEAARQRREESDIRYEGGLLSFNDWELIVIDYANSERSDLRARRDAVLAEARWRLALGEPLGEHL